MTIYDLSEQPFMYEKYEEILKKKMHNDHQWVAFS